MRGKIIDVEFTAAFIQECCLANKANQKEIVIEARTRISRIDDEIRRIEVLKVERSKLTDIVNSFHHEEETRPADSFATNECLVDDFTDHVRCYIGENAPVVIADVVKRFGGSVRNKTFLALKKLSESGLVSRDQSRNFIRGPMWSSVLPESEEATCLA